MNIQAIVGHITSFDGRNDSEVDSFINKISDTSEFQNEVVNDIDYDVDDLLIAIALNPDNNHKEIIQQISTLRDTIRERAIDLYCEIDEENNQPQSTWEANGFNSERDFQRYINGGSHV